MSLIGAYILFIGLIVFFIYLGEHSIALFLTIAIVVLSFMFYDTLAKAYHFSNEGTIDNADIQVTVGVYCVDGNVMYKERDSLRRSSDTLLLYNENTFHGEMPVKLSCHAGEYYDETGKIVSQNQVLKLVTENVISGYLPYSADKDKEPSNKCRLCQLNHNVLEMP